MLFELQELVKSLWKQKKATKNRHKKKNTACEWTVCDRQPDCRGSPARLLIQIKLSDNKRSVNEYYFMFAEYINISPFVWATKCTTESAFIDFSIYRLSLAHLHQRIFV